MTLVRKSLNKVKDHVKKIKQVRQVRQVEVFSKRSKNVDNFSGSYFKGFVHKVYSIHHIQSALSASTGGYSGVLQQSLTQGGQGTFYSSASRPSLDHTCFNCVEKRHFRKE